MSSISFSSAPPELQNASGLHLITQTLSLPCQAVQILLEELAACYGISCTTTRLLARATVSQTPWLASLVPSGSSLPVLLDRSQDPPRVLADVRKALTYLLDLYDRHGVFGFGEERERWLAG